MMCHGRPAVCGGATAPCATAPCATDLRLCGCGVCRGGVTPGCGGSCSPRPPSSCSTGERACERARDERLLSYINFLDQRDERKEKLRQTPPQQPIIVFEGEKPGCGGNKGCQVT